MGKARATEGEALERRRRERQTGAALVDMRIDVEFDGEILGWVGGRWDKRAEEFTEDEPEQGVVVRPHPGQIPAIKWFIDWLGVHAGRRDDPPELTQEELEGAISTVESIDDEAYSALFAGGRRGGKTWIAAVCCAMYAVMFPEGIVWPVSPSEKKDAEVKRYLSRLLSPNWLARRPTAQKYELINGSIIDLKSAYIGADTDAIKEGEAHLIWLNEGQKMKHRVYVVARGAISDKAGLVLVCANPPVEAGDQDWVNDFAADCIAKRREAVYKHFNPLDNPHINRRALLAMRKELDERTFSIEVLGEFRAAIDAVAYNWTRIECERPMPRPTRDAEGRQLPCPVTGLLDVTAEFLEIEEEGEGFDDLLGLDVQVHPHIGGPVYRFYAKPGEVANHDNVIAWIVGEAIVEAGDEEHWTALLRDRGFSNETTIIVSDATAEYQHSRRRQADSPPPEWKGKGSWDIIRDGGYTNIRPPSRRFRRKNPDVLDRIRSFTSLIQAADKKRRLFADPELAPKCCAAIRGWKTVHGRPSRIQEHAHLGDAVSYPIVRLFPRIFRSDKPGGVDAIQKALDKPAPAERGLGAAPDRPRAPGRRGTRNRGL
jgi:hypothetical protein